MSGICSKFLRALLGISVVIACLVPAAPARAAVPAGFQVTSLPTGQRAYDLTAFEFTPDGGWFAIGKSGLVTWTSPVFGSRRIAQLDVVTAEDLGLVGLAVAPGWPDDPTIYTTRALPTSAGTVLRLSKWRVTVDDRKQPVALAGETTILELPARTNVHMMSEVLAAQDGTLWVSVGDSADFRKADPLALDALDPEQGYGKLLHVWPDGRGVANNPLYDAAAPTSWRSRMYAGGLRSPFRFSMDPVTGAPILGDVGWNDREEINIVRPGQSLGWPCFEGNRPTPGYSGMAGCAGATNSAPLIDYQHGPMGTSITGGLVYTGTRYPQEYRGRYFFGDYASNRLYTSRHDATGKLLTGPEPNGFISGEGAPVAIRPGPNGDVVWADILSGTMKRLSWVGGNRAPVAAPEVVTDPATRTATFDAGTTMDPDGDALTHSWDFGDGATASTAHADHQYAGDGPYTVRYTATDSLGAASTAVLTVHPANHTPTLTLRTPPAGTQFAVGDRVRLSATATDAEDGQLGVTWSTTLVHCSGGYCHRHPGSSTSGATYDQPFVDHGDNTYLLLTATARDATGASVSASWEARPKLRTLSVTSTAQTPVTINSTATSAQSVTVGAAVSVSVAATSSDGVASFERWSDGGSRARTLTMPDADVTLHAVYLTPIDRRFNSDPALRALIGPAIGPETGSATSRTRPHSAGELHWTPATGVKELHGAIRATYLAEGGEPAFGRAATDETPTADGRGRFNELLGGTGGVTSIYWSPETPASAVYGAIRTKWAATGLERGPLGYPVTSERSAVGGRFNLFQYGSVHWSPAIGAHEVHGEIYRRWDQFGREGSLLRLPVTDELPTPDGVGRFNYFEGGSIYWSPETGAYEIHGAILDRWSQLGWETSVLGYPTTNELPTPDGTGRYNHFRGGSVYWSPQTGAHEVYGAILERWSQLGWETSWLGYPTSGEYDVPGGRRSNFQGGWIEYRFDTREVIVGR